MITEYFLCVFVASRPSPRFNGSLEIDRYFVQILKLFNLACAAQGDEQFIVKVLTWTWYNGMMIFIFQPFRASLGTRSHEILIDSSAAFTSALYIL